MPVWLVLSLPHPIYRGQGHVVACSIRRSGLIDTHTHTHTPPKYSGLGPVTVGLHVGWAMCLGTPGWRVGFSKRKLSAPVFTTMALVGVAYLLGRRCDFHLHVSAPGEDCQRRRDPPGGIVRDLSPFRS